MALAWLVLTALVSDIFDGVLARHWHCDTAGVRLFDSMADTVFYVCVAVALWIGQPQIWRDNAALLIALIALEAIGFGVAMAKFGKPASYHSYLAKAWGLVMAAAVIAAFASRRAGPLVTAALALGIACNLQGLAMSWILPVWRKDVKTLRAAWLLRKQGQENSRWTAPNAKLALTAVLALLLLTGPAFAMEPGHAAYAGGTAKIALNTPGTLDATSPVELIFKYSGSNGTPGEARIAYAKIRSIEPRQDVVRHLGFLPAVAVGLVAARQRRYTVTISYTDSTDAMQVAIFQMAPRDQRIVQGILHARAPQSCMVMPYGGCPANPAPRPLPAPATPTAPK
jgi:CDP-diacylglycerol--glycerol-3-phosphate 3-phosphatidyltransferase